MFMGVWGCGGGTQCLRCGLIAWFLCPKRLNAWNQVDLGIALSNFRGCTPLMVAAYRGRSAAVARLLALGADIGLQSVHGSFATHWACYGELLSSLALLLDAGASMDARNNDGLTPLMMAVARGAAECVTLLLSRFGGGVEEQLAMVDDDGSSVVHLACIHEQPATLALLLDAGTSMDARNNDGRPPLMVAVVCGATDCVTLLLARFGDGMEGQFGMVNNNGSSVYVLGLRIQQIVDPGFTARRRGFDGCARQRRTDSADGGGWARGD